MRVVPKRPSRQLSFFQAHLRKWRETYASIGLSEAEVDAIEARLDAAKEAYDAQLRAYSVARAATSRFRNASRQLAQAGANAILRIRTTAQTSGDPNVYALGWLPKPKKPSPIAEPGNPYLITFKLLQNGPLQLEWKCKNPVNANGTMYELWRTVDRGPKEFLAVTGEKWHVDTTVPAGAKDVVYSITAVRGKKRGKPVSYAIELGVKPGSIHPALRFPRPGARARAA